MVGSTLSVCASAVEAGGGGQPSQPQQQSETPAPQTSPPLEANYRIEITDIGIDDGKCYFLNDTFTVTAKISKDNVADVTRTTLPQITMSVAGDQDSVELINTQSNGDGTYTFTYKVVKIVGNGVTLCFTASADGAEDAASESKWINLRNRLQVTVKESDGTAITDATVKLYHQFVNDRIVTFSHDKNGVYTHNEWTVEVDDFDKVVITLNDGRSVEIDNDKNGQPLLNVIKGGVTPTIEVEYQFPAYKVIGKLYFNGNYITKPGTNNAYTFEIGGKYGANIDYSAMRSHFEKLVKNTVDKDNAPASATATVWKDGGTTWEAATKFGSDAAWPKDGTTPCTTAYVTVNVVTSYNISFDTGGGSAVEAETVQYGQDLDLTGITSSRNGYKFLGWMLSAAGEDAEGELVEKLTNVTKSVTLTAKWEANEYTVVFNANGGVYEDYKTPPETHLQKFSTKAYGAELVMQGSDGHFKKDGYTLMGWALDKDATTAAYTVGQKVAFTEANFKDLETLADGGTITLYAVWKGNSYKLLYHANYAGAESVTNESNGKYGTAISIKQSVNFETQNTGYTLIGWSTTADGAVVYKYGDRPVFEAADADESDVIHLYAVWEANTYTVTYKITGSWYLADTAVNTTKDVQYNADIPDLSDAINNVTKGGFQFSGWTYADGTALSDKPNMPDEDITLTGSFKRAANFVIEAVPDQTYTGSAITPTLTVTVGTATLKLGEDYTVVYSNNINAGTASATVMLKNTSDYYDVTNGQGKTVTFTILKAASEIVITAPADAVYDGNAHPVTCMVLGVDNEEITDAVVCVKYEKVVNGTADETTNTSDAPVNAGDYVVTVHYAGNDNYKGAYLYRVSPFTIDKATPTVTVAAEDATYTGRAYDAANLVNISVEGVNGEVLTYGVTYYKCDKDGNDIGSYIYSYNTASVGASGELPTDAGYYKVGVTVQDHNNYNNVPWKQVIFQIKKADVKAAITAEGRQYNGVPYEASFTITSQGSGAELTDNYYVQYTVSDQYGYKSGDPIYTYKTNKWGQNTTGSLPVNAGYYVVSVCFEGDDNHNQGWFEKVFQITKSEISAEYTGTLTKVYDGEKFEADATKLPLTGAYSYDTSKITYVIYDQECTNRVDAINVGSYKLVITIPDDDNHIGTKVEKDITITPANIGDATITLNPTSYVYNTDVREPAVTVTWNGKTLDAAVDGDDNDYTVAYTNNTNVGTATVTITGKGNFENTNAKTFTITPAELADGNIALEYTEKDWTGSALTPTVTVKYTHEDKSEITLTKDADYTVTYENNVNVGTATVKVEGINNYSGTVNKTFTIKNASYAGTIRFTVKTGSSNGNKPVQGAVFGLYTDKACSSSNRIQSATSDADGVVSFTRTEVIAPNATVIYYVKQISAPSGYSKDSRTYQVVLTPVAGTGTFTFTKTALTSTSTYSTRTASYSAQTLSVNDGISVLSDDGDFENPPIDSGSNSGSTSTGNVVSVVTVTFMDGDEYDLEAQKGTTLNKDGSIAITLSGAKVPESKIPDVIAADAYYRFAGWAVENKYGELEEIDLETYKFTTSTKVYALMADLWTPYTDMKQDRSDWYYQYARDLSIAGVVNGVPGGAFAPAEEVTWGVALKLVMLAVGYDEQAKTGSHWASGYLTAALRDGLVTDASIDLNATLTRIEYAYLAVRAMGLKEVKMNSPYMDTSDPAVLALYKAGIMEGTNSPIGRMFNPDSNITRAEMSAIIWRINKYED